MSTDKARKARNVDRLTELQAARAKAEREVRRLAAEHGQLQRKHDAIAQEVETLRADRKLAAKAAVGDGDDRAFRKVCGAVGDAESRLEALDELLREHDVTADGAQQALAAATHAESAELHRLAVEAAVSKAEQAAARVRAVFGELCFALGAFTLDASELADLDTAAAARITAGLSPDSLTAELLANAACKIVTISAERDSANALSAVAIVADPALAPLATSFLPVGEVVRRLAEAGRDAEGGASSARPAA